MNSQQATNFALKITAKGDRGNRTLETAGFRFHEQQNSETVTPGGDERKMRLASSIATSILAPGARKRGSLVLSKQLMVSEERIMSIPAYNTEFLILRANCKQ